MQWPDAREDKNVRHAGHLISKRTQ